MLLVYMDGQVSYIMCHDYKVSSVTRLQLKIVEKVTNGYKSFMCDIITALKLINMKIG